MAPRGKQYSISQQAFDVIVKENIDVYEMDPSEALADAIETLTLKGVDLSGILTRVPCHDSLEDNSVVQCLEKLKKFEHSDLWNEDVDRGELTALLVKLTDLCGVKGNAAIVANNNGVELVCSLCSTCSRIGHQNILPSSLKALGASLRGVQATDKFHKSHGEMLLIYILNLYSHNMDILDYAFSVVAAAATGNEAVKESFMNLKIDELIVQLMKDQNRGYFHSLYDAIRALLTSDDNRVVASQVYGYARRFAKLGITGALVELLHEGQTSLSLLSVTAALKSLAVNDEICTSIAELGGVNAILCCIRSSGMQRNQVVVRSCCSLLAKLAGSDVVKGEIVKKDGLGFVMEVSARLSDDPSVVQEVMAIICVLCLRLPDNAARAVQAGAGDLAIEAMKRFPTEQLLQKNSCLMIRNLVVRNPENRSLLLQNGVEMLIRQAKKNHPSCKDAAIAALRDLGIQNYNI